MPEYTHRAELIVRADDPDEATRQRQASRSRRTVVEELRRAERTTDEALSFSLQVNPGRGSA